MRGVRPLKVQVTKQRVNAQHNQNLTKNLLKMNKNYPYVNTNVQKATDMAVREYLDAVGTAGTPIYDMWQQQGGDPTRFIRAGKKMGQLTVSCGNVYENGIMWPNR